MKTEEQIFANQHFVPQFYLRLFSDDEKKIAKYNKHSGRKTEKSSIIHTASRKGFYDYEYEHQKLTSEVEKELGAIEQEAADIIKPHIAKPEDFKGLPLARKITLARFFGLQYARTLKFRKFQEKEFDYFIKCGYALAEAEKNHTDFETELKKMSERPFYFINRSQFLIGEMKELARLAGQVMLSYSWTLVGLRSDTFVTSDSPVARIINDEGQDEFMIALGPKLILLMAPGEYYGGKLEFLQESNYPSAILSIFQKAYSYNKLMCEQSYLEIYGNSKLVDDAVARYKPGFSMAGAGFGRSQDENVQLHEQNFPVDAISNSDIEYYRKWYGKGER